MLYLVRPSKSSPISWCVRLIWFCFLLCAVLCSHPINELIVSQSRNQSLGAIVLLHLDPDPFHFLLDTVLRSTFDVVHCRWPELQLNLMAFYFYHSRRSATFLLLIMRLILIMRHFWLRRNLFLISEHFCMFITCLPFQFECAFGVSSIACSSFLLRAGTLSFVCWFVWVLPSDWNRFRFLSKSISIHHSFKILHPKFVFDIILISICNETILHLICFWYHFWYQFVHLLFWFVCLCFLRFTNMYRHTKMNNAAFYRTPLGVHTLFNSVDLADQRINSVFDEYRPVWLAPSLVMVFLVRVRV